MHTRKSSFRNGAGDPERPSRRVRPDASAGGPALRPPRPERPELPPQIKSKVLRFEKLREAYLDRQQGLLRKLRGATDADRAQVRAQLQALRDEWLEKARSFREEARARLRELPDELPKYRELLQESVTDAASQSHPHRGVGDH